MPGRKRIVADSATFPLDIRPQVRYRSAHLAHSRGVTGDSRLMERDAVPAGGICNPALGRPWGSARPALGPVCEELAALGLVFRRVTPAAASSRETRPGAEPAVSLASSAVERREASAPEAGGLRKRADLRRAAALR